MAQAHSLFFLLLLCSLHASTGAKSWVDHATSIGVVMDFGSPSWREEKVAMEMSIDDFHKLTGHRPELHVRDSRGDPLGAASAAMSLINERHVRAVIGPRTWREVAFIAELGQRACVPILSFVKACPPSATERWPYLVRAARNQHSQMRAVAAIIRSWHWRKVTIVYEDIDYSATSIIPHLADALRGTGTEIDYRLAISPFATSLTEKLEQLKSRQCRVFVFHASMALATRFFAEAKRMGMMEEGYVWITTDGITSLLDSANSSTIASMEGVLGVRDYFNPHRHLSDFIARFRQRFRVQYNEDVSDPTQFHVLQAYDAVRAISMAINRTVPSSNPHNCGAKRGGAMESSEDLIHLWVSSDGASLVESIRQSNFTGLNGQFHFVDGEFAPSSMFQIVNVVGKRYREVGFWSHESGFSKSIRNRGGDTMEALGQIYWPGGPFNTVPRGWDAFTKENPLRIAVPAKVVFPDFVRLVDVDQPMPEGFSVEVFMKVLDNLNYRLHHVFLPFNRSYDSVIEDQMRDYDILIGDTSISSGRYQFVEFSQPYTPSGLVMVVPASTVGSDKSWIFLKPFTASMWVLIVAIGVYNGVVVWLIERRLNEEFSGSFWKQTSTLLWVSFTSLLAPGGNLRSNLSRMAMLVWLFTAVVLTTNYTAILSSILTAQWIQPNLVTVVSLKSSEAKVGYSNGSVVGKYLVEVLGFHRKNVKNFSSEEDFYRALKTGEIKAAFLRTFHAKLLMAKYCREFTTTGPTYNVGGLGFVFPRGSPLLADISQAILKVFENGTIEELENAMIASYNCSDDAAPGAAGCIDGLSPASFWGLLVVTVLVSTVALTLYGLFLYRNDVLGDGTRHGGVELVPK